MIAHVQGGIDDGPVLSTRTFGLIAAAALAGIETVYILMVLISLTTETSDLQLVSVLAFVVAAPALLCVLGSVVIRVPPTRSLPALLALTCGTIYAALTTFTYFLQATVVRLALPTPRYDRFALLDMQNQDSVTAVTEMAGYLFLGLTLLSLSLTFMCQNTRIEQRLVRLCLTGGGLCVISVGAFVLTMQTIRYLALAALCPVLLGIAVALIGYFRSCRHAGYDWQHCPSKRRKGGIFGSRWLYFSFAKCCRYRE